MSLFYAGRLPRWVERSVAILASQWDSKKRRKPKTVTLFPEVEHWHKKSSRKPWLCTRQQVYYIMYKGKASIYKSSRSKGPKTRVAGYKHKKKTSGLCLWYETGVYFSCLNNFANLSSFTKVSISVMPIIPWFVKDSITV